jgi:hypothetical protein
LIETWQYVALGGVLAIFVAIGLYEARRASVRDDAFFATLEATAASVLVAQQFVLTNKAHTPESFGNRFWYFERPPRTIRVFWDGRDREFAVEVRDRGAATPVRKRSLVSGPAPRASQESYRRVLDDLLEALDSAVHADA